jgi:DNA-binding NarL/FixJ family response regulator/signal transduction histidine kinase
LSLQNQEIESQREELEAQNEEVSSLSKELVRREAMLQLLLEASRTLRPEADVLAIISHSATELLGESADAVALLEKKGDRLRLCAQEGLPGAPSLLESTVEGSFEGLVMQQRRTAALDDVTLRPDLTLFPVGQDNGFRAVLASPIWSKDEPVGVVNIYSRKARQWTTKQFRVAEWLAGECLLVLETLRQREALRELNETLEQRVAERTADVQREAEQLRALAVDPSETEQRERKRLARILHDHIQQLIVAARMQVELLRRDVRPEPVLEAAYSLDGILHEALEASRSLAVDISPPVLHEAGLISALNRLASRMLEQHQFTVRLRTDSKAEHPAEETRLLLFECVRELLLNSAKHSGTREADVALLRAKEDEVKLIVRDNGKGFDPDVVKKRRSDEASFGLFSIQERLAHLGGQMVIESAPGRGTLINVTVPVVEEKRHTEETGGAPPTQDHIGRIRIRPKAGVCRVLIVDDHQIVRQGLAGMFQFESDIEVIGEAADGPEAIELARKLKPNVVIMDVNLGEMNGVETTGRILANDPKIKVIGLSMHADRDVAKAMHDAGAVAYLTKEGPSKDLIAAIRACGTSGTKPARILETGGERSTARPRRPRKKALSRAKKIRVLIVDDTEAMREVLALHLSHEADIIVVAKAADGKEGIRLARSRKADVVVMDARMAGMDGIEATRRLRRELPRVRVIGLSAYAGTDEEPAAMRAAGALDGVMKESSCKKLIAAIRECMGG